MMFYLVRVDVDVDIADEWQRWMVDVHIPDVVATDCFDQAWMARRPAADTAERKAFRMIYLAPSRQHFERYEREFAPALQAEHTDRYEGRFQASRELLDVMEQFPD